MTHLKPRERALLWLAYAQGSSHKEIAESLGLRTASVKLLLFRARRRLATLLTRSRGAARGKERTVKLHCPVRAGAAGRGHGAPVAGSGRRVAAQPRRRLPVCADVAEIAAAFFEDRELARAEAVVPAASAVWWRAQIAPAKKPHGWRSARS